MVGIERLAQQFVPRPETVGDVVGVDTRGVLFVDAVVIGQLHEE